MDLQFYVEKLYSSENYVPFRDEFPEAYPCGGFFVVDFTGKEKEQAHFDFYDLGTEKAWSFRLEDKNERVLIEQPFAEAPGEIAMNLSCDFDELKEEIETRMKSMGVKNHMEKMLLSLQHLDGKDYFVGTIFLSMMGMLKIKYNLSDRVLEDVEKKSFMDFLKVEKK